MASGQLQFPSPDQNTRGTLMLSQPLFAGVPLCTWGIPTLSNDRNITSAGCPGFSTVLLLHQILWNEKVHHQPESPWEALGVWLISVSGEEWLLLISMHMDALYCLPWIHLAFLGIVNVPPQRFCMESFRHFYPLIMRDSSAELHVSCL